MVYSCAYFRTPETGLEDARVAKLETSLALVDEATFRAWVHLAGCVLAQF